MGTYEVLSLIRENPISEIPTGVKKIGAPVEWELSGTKGEHASVCVVDTGTPNHPDLDVVDSFGGEDTDGHATHVAGTICANGRIKGVAPEAKLYTANYSHQGTATAIEWAIEQDVDVINISLGSKNSIRSTHEAIKRAKDKGIIVVTSAGNSGGSGLTYPAVYPETIAVGAIRENRDKTLVSSVGEEVEVVALGWRVESTYLQNGYATSAGTSMASPHIAGAVALIQSKAKMLHGRRLTLEEIRAILHNRAQDLGTKGRNENFGYGVFSFDTNIKESTTIKMSLDSKVATLNGQEYEMNIKPVIKDNRSLVPLRDVGEMLDLHVQYENREITMTDNP